MLQVDAQVNKIARIFREREQASQELARTINKAGAQLNYVWRLTLVERHRNARLATSNDQTGDALKTLEKHIENLGKDQLEPLNSDFQRVQIADENARSLAKDMESDIACIADSFERMCRDPLVLLREEILRLQQAHERRMRIAECKSRERDRLRALVDQQSLDLDRIITEKLALTSAYDKTALNVSALQASIEDAKSAMESKKRECDEMVQWNRSEERKKTDEIASTRASLESAKEESVALDVELERAHTSKHAHLQITETESRRAVDQNTRCLDTRKRTAELEVRQERLLKSIADMKAREECAQKDCQIMHKQQQIAHARVHAEQETTLSLVETIAKQQLLMTETVLQHDERQTQQSKLYQALQVQKDSQRAAALQTAQQVKDLLEELQHQSDAASQQTDKLSLLRVEMQEASQARNLQQRAADKELIAAAETEEALRAHMEARMQGYADDIHILIAAKEVEVHDAIQKHNVMQQKEKEMSLRVHALAASPNSLAESTRLLPGLQSELDRLISECIEEQQLSLEAALQEKMSPQLQALNELNSGKRLEAERKRSETTIRELEGKIEEAVRTARDLSRVSPPLCTTDLEENPGFQHYTRVNSKSRYPAPSQPVSPLTSISPTVTPVKASPRDWFTDADMW